MTEQRRKAVADAAKHAACSYARVTFDADPDVVEDSAACGYWVVAHVWVSPDEVD